MREKELTSVLRAEIERHAAADRFAGAALIARNGSPVFAEAYGLADRKRKIPNTLETRFRLGSMTKMFTATAVIQLVEAGELDLSARVGEYLPKYPNTAVSELVTVEHLLTHTGGTGDFFGPEFHRHRRKLKTLADYLSRWGSAQLRFPPGSRWEYSNFGFIILGLLIEAISGQNYYDYIREHIYTPAEMTRSGAEPEDRDIEDRSIGYTKMRPNSGGKWQPNTNVLSYRASSSANSYSTVRDLVKFATAIEQHKLLGSYHTELLTRPRIETPGGRYAYGFLTGTINGARFFGHSGYAPGMNGDLKIWPESGFVAAVLTNLDPPGASRISDFIAHRLD